MKQHVKPANVWHCKALVCVMLLVIVGGSLVQGASTVELETSIVSLVLKSGEIFVETDMFFELLDMGNYILVPLNTLAAKLDWIILFDRETGMVSVNCPDSQKTVEIDIMNSVYINHPEWAGQPPLELYGEIYVTTSMLEFLSGVKCLWDIRYQELTIVGDWQVAGHAATDGTKANLADGNDAAQENLTPTVVGPDFSLGSIQYQMVWDLRKKATGQENLQARLALGIYGRAGAWSISAKTDVQIDDLEEEDSFLPFFRAKYNEENHLLIIGDSEFNFQNTLGKNILRGAYYSYPAQSFNRLVAYTVISGAAEPGDTVQLFVNGTRKDQKRLVEGEYVYTFLHVPLIVHRINTVTVLVKKLDGTEHKVSKKIAASPRILEAGTREITAATGLYRSSDNNVWEGNMIGVLTNTALHPKVSISAEAVRASVFTHEEVIYGSQLGVAFNLGTNTIITLDWLVGGTEEQLAQGGKTDLLYCLERGYVEGIVFYVPEQVATGVKTVVGKGVQLIGVWDLNPYFTWQANGSVVEPGKADGIALNYNGQLKLTGRWGEQLSNKTALAGAIREYTLLPNEEGVQSVQEKEVIVEHRTRQSVVTEKGEVTLVFSDISTDTATLEGKMLNITEEISLLLFKSLLLSNNLDLSMNWMEDTLTRGEIQMESKFKWGSEKFWLTGAATLVGKKNEQTEGQIKIDEVGGNAGILYYLNQRNTLGLNAGQVQKNYAGYSYSTAELSFTHRTTNDLGKLNLRLGYVSPVERRTVPQWTAGIEYEQFLGNDLELKVKAQRMYNTMTEEKPEYLISLTLSHALGFAGKVIQGQRYSSEEYKSFIGGVVYLDENHNGMMDEGEKRLPGIKMALEGRREVTDDNGVFRFDYIDPGLYRVGYDMRKLAADFTPVVENEVVQIRENENIFLTFGLTMSGSISGMVFIDANANGLRDVGEEPLKWVSIRLNDKISAFTKNDGSFYFENLNLGEYTLTVDPKSLPVAMEVAAGIPETIWLTHKNVDVQDLFIPVVSQFGTSSTKKQERVPESTPKAEREVESTPESNTPQTVLQDQPLAVNPVPQQVEPATPQVFTNQAQVEKHLIELTSNVLKMDLASGKAFYNGQEVQIPFIMTDNQIWLPLRTMARVFNIGIYWDPLEQMVFLTDADKSILLDIKLGFLMTGGERYEVVDQIRLYNNYTYVTEEVLRILDFVIERQDESLSLQKQI